MSQLLYKYFAVDRVKEILTENKIFLPSPRDFNDPFDSKCRLIFSAPRRKRERYSRELIKQKAPGLPKFVRNKMAKRGSATAAFEEAGRRFIDRLSRVPMLCLSERKDSVLMWSHYADKHQGVCLEFRDIAINGIVPLEVAYSENYPTVDFFEMKLFMSHMDAKALAKQRELVDRIYLTKAKDWQYEREWRLINFRGERGFHWVLPETITAVVFGCRTSDADKQKVSSWIAHGTTKPRLYQAVESQTSYSLDIIDSEPRSSSFAG